MKMKSVVERVRVGDTLHLLVGLNTDDIKPMIAALEKKAKRTGETITFADGTKVWYEREPIIDLKKEGSARYTWAKDGNRVKCKFFKHTIPIDGCKEIELLGTCFALFD